MNFVFMKKEVIELEAISFGYGFHFKLLDDKTGIAHENFIESGLRDTIVVSLQSL